MSDAARRDGVDDAAFRRIIKWNAVAVKKRRAFGKGGNVFKPKKLIAALASGMAQNARLSTTLRA